MAQYANPNQFGAPMGDNDGGYMEQVRLDLPSTSFQSISDIQVIDFGV